MIDLGVEEEPQKLGIELIAAHTRLQNLERTLERKLIAERVRAGLRNARAKGKCVGGSPAWL